MLRRKKEAPCPYCYQPLDPEQASYRCQGQPAPGAKTRCQPAEDKRRLQVFSDATPVLPTFQKRGAKPASASERGKSRHGVLCPQCEGVTGTRVCDACHSVLPHNFTARSPLFAVVGLRGSGKTVYLSILSKEMTGPLQRRFGASIHEVGSSNYLRKLQQYRAAMDGGGPLPVQTSTFSAGKTQPAVFEWQMETKRGLGHRSTSTILSFYDTAGEDLQTLDQARAQHYVAAADGLILLLDPSGFPSNRAAAQAKGMDAESIGEDPSSVLHRITEVLRTAEGIRSGGGGKIKRPLAVVLAKIDAYYDQIDSHDPIRRPAPTLPVFDERDSLDVHEHVKAHVSRWDGEDVLNTLHLNYANYRLFGASALGAEPDYQANRVNQRGVLPHRVAEPLLWLMARHGFVRKVR